MCWAGMSNLACEQTHQDVRRVPKTLTVLVIVNHTSFLSIYFLLPVVREVVWEELSDTCCR
jgi:hypothetical protein